MSDAEFKGEIPFDLTISMFGKRIKRRARVAYEHSNRDEQERTSCHIDIEAIPEDYEDADGNIVKGVPEWVDLQALNHDGILPEEIWDKIFDSIDRQCKAEDRERRKVAKSAARLPNLKSKE